MARTLTKRWARWNGWLTALLLVLVAVQVNRLAGRFLALRQDFSQDQLYAIAPATRAILGRLDDQLTLDAYITDRVELGSLALLQGRVRSQLAELASLGGDRVRVSEVDPSVNSTALTTASSFGMRPYQYGQSSGTRVSAAVAYMGLVLRYRGREEVLPQLNPWTLESEFAGAVRRLLSDRRRVIAWLGDSISEDPEASGLYGSYSIAQARLGVRYEVQALDAARLAAGSPIPDKVEAIVVARPRELQLRAVYALDQFVQRGGRLLICIDQVLMGFVGQSLHAFRGEEPERTGLERLLANWGAPVLPVHVWDVELAGAVQRAVAVPDTSDRRLVPLVDPACPRYGPGQGDGQWPPTAAMGQLQLYWAQPIGEATALPAGLKRTDVLHTSDRTWPTEGLQDQAVLSADMLDSLSMSFGHRADLKRSWPLATVLEGRFPTPFTRGAPAPFDATMEESDGPVKITDEPVLDAAADSAVIVIGDADWLRDPAPAQYRALMPGLESDHGRLLDDIVDWLLRDDELIAVRAKQPRSRPLHDFEGEARDEVGMGDPKDVPDSRGEAEARSALRAKAERTAGLRRLRAMLIPPGVVMFGLVLVSLFAAAWSRRKA